MAHPAHARPRSRQLLFLACTLPLLATATACGSGSEEPTGKSPETTSSAPPTTSSSASPTTSTSHATPKPTLASDTDQTDEGTPEPATSPHNVAPQPDRSNGAATTPGPPAASAPDYNCRNRSAPPLNNTTIPMAGGGSFHYTLKANRYNPCKTLSWIHIAGEHDGPKEAVLLYHNGNPVNSPQPRLITAVTEIQRLGDDAVQVTYRTAQGATGSVTTRATSNGVHEESNTLPPGVDSGAPRLAGAHS